MIDCIFRGHPQRPNCRCKAEVFLVGKLVWPLCSSCAMSYRRTVVRMARRGLRLSQNRSYPLREREVLRRWKAQGPEKLRSLISSVDQRVSP